MNYAHDLCYMRALCFRDSDRPKHTSNGKSASRHYMIEVDLTSDVIAYAQFCVTYRSDEALVVLSHKWERKCRLLFVMCEVTSYTFKTRTAYKLLVSTHLFLLTITINRCVMIADEASRPRRFEHL